MKIILLFILLCTTNLFGQNIVDDAYKIIPIIVSQDTIVKEIAKRSIEYRVSVGKMTKEDSISYMAAVKNRTLKVSSDAINMSAKSVLKKAYGHEKQMPKYIPKERLNEILESIPEDGPHPSFEMYPRIKIFSGKYVGRCHSFSSPILINENQYLIYHTFHFGRSLSKREFIIYTVDINKDCTIDAEIDVPPFFRW